MLVFFLLPALACNYPGWDEVQENLDLPTPAPTLAPSDDVISPGEIPSEALTAPPAASDQTFQATGVKTSYGSSIDASCQSEAPLTLVLRGDGTAELSTTGPAYTDHYNCISVTDETWYINGTVDAAEQAVTFTSCNNGGFTGSGIIYYGGSVLSGEVSCSLKDNDEKVFMLVVNK